jgi:RecA/RadA recombinase
MSKNSDSSSDRKSNESKTLKKSTFNIVDVDNILDTIEKNYSLSGLEMHTDEARQSAGLLMLDILLGKGLMPGWYTLCGAEQSSKSTTAVIVMAASLYSDVPILAYFDYEGSSSPDYLEAILKVNGIEMPIEHVFGIRSPKGGWVKKPRVRLYSENIGERFFDFLAKLERTLPDKRKMGGTWYYVYEDPKKIKALKGKVDYDKNYLQKTGKLRFPTGDNGTLQAVLITDSYPAMLPEKQDVDDPNAAIAVQARMFSDQLKRVKGRLKPKRIAVLGVNQLRDAPLVMFGPKNYEPGGNALKLYSDVRLMLVSRAIPHKSKEHKTGMLEEEQSVQYEGFDTYRYVNARTIKNKLSVPHLEAWFRIWVSDANGIARGIDLVWDTYMYLLFTDQCSGSKGLKTKNNKILLSLDGKDRATKAITWLEFKTILLGKDEDIKKIFKKIGMKPIRLYKFCKKQLSQGNGLDLFFEAKRKSTIERKLYKNEDGGDD